MPLNIMPTNPAYSHSENRLFQTLSDTIQAEMQRLQVPGVALGVYADGQQMVRGFGVTSVDNPLPVTEDSLFQIGSITKTFLTTLVLCLVETGRLDLDSPIINYLPDLHMSDATVREQVTMRHLLTHTGGWVGDYFNDFGAGGDALQRMVVEVGRLPQLYPLGEFWSYNNSGFYLAGRVIEVLTGLPFETALKQYVLSPLGLKRALFFPEDILLERFAAGHEVIDKQVAVARPWAVPRAVAPAGGLVTDIPTLLRYARYHMGEWDDFESHILSLERVKEMQQPLLPATGFSRMGLSWWIDDFDGVKIIRHGGGTKGQIAHLAIVPEKRFALAILTNCEEADPLILAIRKQAFQSYLGISFPIATPLKMPPSETAEFIGEYQNAMDTLLLSATDGGLLLQDIPKGGFPTPDTPPGPMPPAVRLAFYAPDKVIGLEEPYHEARGEFLRDSKGKVAWLRLGGRVHLRQ